MPAYHHTQPGTFARVILGGFGTFICGAVFIVLLGNLADGKAVQMAIGLVVCVLFFASALACFHSLSVHVSDKDVRLSYGVGLIHKRFPLKDIKSAEVVRNSWHYHKIGITKVWGGWVYSISGFDAVELRFKNDKFVRIGTDEPQKLHAAIESAMEGSS